MATTKALPQAWPRYYKPFVAYGSFSLVAVLAILVFLIYAVVIVTLYLLYPLLLAYGALKKGSFRRNTYLKWSGSENIVRNASDIILQQEEYKGIQEEWHTVEVMGEKVAYRILKRDPVGAPSQETLLFVHGTGGSALKWIWSIARLDYRCLALDLPGFGISTPSEAIRSGTKEQVIEFYVQFLEKALEQLQLDKVTLVAHSFGGFISVFLAKRHPELFKRVIFVNTAGIFPTIGRYGAYWALMFSLGLPYRLTRGIGGAITSLLWSYMYEWPEQGGIKHLYKMYFYHLHGRSSADLTVMRFITLGVYSYWNHPSLLSLLALKVPVAMVYGANDPLMPPHMGETVSALTKGRVPCFLIKGAWHNPLDYNFAREFTIALRDALGAAAEPDMDPKTMDNLRAFDMDSFKGVFSPSVMAEIIQSLYRSLLEIAGASPSDARVITIGEEDIRQRWAEAGDEGKVWARPLERDDPRLHMTMRKFSVFKAFGK